MISIHLYVLKYVFLKIVLPIQPRLYIHLLTLIVVYIFGHFIYQILTIFFFDYVKGITENGIKDKYYYK